MDPIRTIIVDDAVTFRILLAEALRPMVQVEVVGTAANGAIALEQVRKSSPDLVLLDLEMPVMNGFETLDVLGREFPAVGVIIVSGVDPESAGRTLKALQLGAFHFVEKPHSSGRDESMQCLRRSLESAIENFAASRQARLGSEVQNRPSQRMRKAAASGAPEPPRLSPAGARPAGPIDAVVVAVSTGGPAALNLLVLGLPADLGVPVLVVQHMPAVFTKSLAESLQQKTRLAVREAGPGDLVGPGSIYIAPGGRHMAVGREGGVVRIRVEDTPPINSCRPSADRLFETAAAVYGEKTLAVVMTGMGSDGCQGVRAIKEAGGRCIAQSRETSTIPSMPMAVIGAGLADEVLPLEGLAARIATLARSGGGR